MDENIIAFFAGACYPKNPCGHLGIGCYIKEKETDKIIFQYSGYVEASDSTSSNVAEYLAFENIIDWLLENGYHDDNITIHSNSSLLINQMKKIWAIKSGYYFEYAIRCLDKINEFSNLKIQFITSNKNQKADKLSKVRFKEMGLK